MTFTTIEVIALFFIAINLFIIFVVLALFLDKYFKYKARIKVETECKVNDDLVKVIVSYCEYAQQKGDKQARLTELHRLLPQPVANRLKKDYGFKIVVNALGEVCIKGWVEETNTLQE